ncbi:hypothetical protein ACFU8I_03545 [Streptomyces sp. NPDC057540]|uniref:hypothetical protein n=1 Tax=Streptomyces sp. NPDC057540 TaxID=3346160 RepID=UPI00369D0A06
MTPDTTTPTTAPVVRPATPDDAAEISRLRSAYVLSEPLGEEWLLDHLTRDGVTLFELHASKDAAPLYEELGFASDPALMRMTRL